MENQNDFHDKYVKYKTKYLNLKNGGGLFTKRKDTVRNKFFEYFKKKFNLRDKKNIVITKLNKYKFYVDDKKGKKIKTKLLNKEIEDNKDFSGLRIKDNSEVTINLDSYNLSNSLFGSDLYGTGIKLNKSSFKNVNFTKSKLYNSQFKNIKFINTNFSDSELNKSNIDNCEFIGSNMTQLVFKNEGLYDDTLSVTGLEELKQKIINSKFKNVILKKTQFIGGPIVNCDFSDNELGQTMFLTHINNSQFKNNTFNGCVFGDLKKNYKNEEINDEQKSILITKSNFSNSKFNTCAFFNVHLEYCDFSNVNSNNKKILLQSCYLFKCKDIFNLIKNSIKEASGLQSNQMNSMRDCIFNKNKFTDNMLYLFDEIVNCEFNNCNFTEVTDNIVAFRRCKFKNCSFNFKSSLYKNLTENNSGDDKHEIIKAKNK
jgi:uncharacterized protein YjbI with pentapeptide repeats